MLFTLALVSLPYQLTVAGQVDPARFDGLVDEEQSSMKRSFHLPYTSQGRNQGFNHYVYHRYSADSAAKVGTAALAQLYGTNYVVGSSTNVLYSAAGGSDDWAKGGAGVKYSYTIELRDTGAHGFVLPTNQIEPNCRESWRGLAEFALSLNTNKGGHRG
uniref:Peptidase M14 domain-containing protein n=1 Tax=Magallana gigas TaxID=29159 RepID=A0A8W8KIA1_MAGGI